MEQIVRLTPDGKLSNVSCTYAPEKPKDCIKHVESYDLNDRDTRLLFRKLGFICRVGGSLYRIAQEEPGFIREGEKKVCSALIFCHTETEVLDLLTVPKDIKTLIAGNTHCYSYNTYSWEI
jgi:hypothetical protein